MKIFITGIAGFLGSHIADEMIALGHEVVGCDNLLGGYVDNVPEGATFYDVDCLDLKKMSIVMKDVDIVYHTACTAYEGLSVFSPSLITDNTLQISVNTMVAAINNKVKRFVHCSSMARYGNLGTCDYKETMDCRPQDPYGIAKHSSELLLKNLADVHGIELVIAIPHNIIGPRQKYDDPYRNVVSIATNLILQGKKPIIYGDGNQTRSFSDVRDVVGCLVKMAFKEDAHGKIYNVGPDEEPVTVNEVVRVICEVMDVPFDPIYVDERPQEVKHATCSSDLIRQELGYQTQYTLKESVKSVVDYIIERGSLPFQYHLPLEIINDLTPKTWKERMF
jgi:UDP-glucose 4-epimerase